MKLGLSNIRNKFLLRKSPISEYNIQDEEATPMCDYCRNAIAGLTVPDESIGEHPKSPCFLCIERIQQNLPRYTEILHLYLANHATRSLYCAGDTDLEDLRVKAYCALDSNNLFIEDTSVGDSPPLMDVKQDIKDLVFDNFRRYITVEEPEELTWFLKDRSDNWYMWDIHSGTVLYVLQS